MKLINVLTTINTVDNLLTDAGLIPAAVNTADDEAMEGVYHFPTVDSRGAKVDEYTVKLTFVTENTFNYRLYKGYNLVLSTTDEQSYVKGLKELLPILLDHSHGLKELTKGIANRVERYTDETLEITIDEATATAMLESRHVLVVIRRHANTGYLIEVSNRKDGVSKFLRWIPAADEVRHIIELAKNS